MLRALAYAFHTGEGGTRFRRVTGTVEADVATGDQPLLLNDYEAFTDTTLGTHIEGYPARLGAPTMQRLPNVAFDRELFREGRPPILFVEPTSYPDTLLATSYPYARGACRVD